MVVFEDNIIGLLMSVSVSENEIVCYNVDDAITNAKVREPAFPLTTHMARGRHGRPQEGARGVT